MLVHIIVYLYALSRLKKKVGEIFVKTIGKRFQTPYNAGSSPMLLGK